MGIDMIKRTQHGFAFFILSLIGLGCGLPDPSGPDEPAADQEVTYIDAGQSIANDSSVPDSRAAVHGVRNSFGGS